MLSNETKRRCSTAINQIILGSETGKQRLLRLQRNKTTSVAGRAAESDAQEETRIEK